MSVQPFPRTTSTNTCDATNVDATPIGVGTPIVKVPVVLQELAVQIPMHAEITFPAGQHVLEVKTIGKKVFVTQCRLINRAPAPGTDPATFNAKLFLSGFVRKNIQYAANPIPDAQGEILSCINSLTVEVPWSCVAEVTGFLNLPVGPFTNQSSTQFFNELPFCELIRADIIEIDESLDRMPFPGPDAWVPARQDGPETNPIIGEGTFTRLSEKMVLDLTLKLLQKQQVRIDSLG